MAIFIHNNTGSTIQQLQSGIYQTFYVSSPTTLDDLLACCIKNGELSVEILNFLKRQGYRKEKISRDQMMATMQTVLNEVRDMKKEIRRRNIPGGANNATN